MARLSEVASSVPRRTSKLPAHPGLVPTTERCMGAEEKVSSRQIRPEGRSTVISASRWSSLTTRRLTFAGPWRLAAVTEMYGTSSPWTINGKGPAHETIEKRPCGSLR